MDVPSLIDLLHRRLLDYGYAEIERQDLGSSLLAVIKTRRRWMVRYVCAIAEVPKSVENVTGVIRYFHQLRKTLTGKYAQFPWWKELGTYSVLMCDASIFADLRGQEARLKDATGLHMNVMLGTVVVNRESLEALSTSTWGLFHSGRHFGAICASVAEWTERTRCTSPASRAPADAGRRPQAGEGPSLRGELRQLARR